MIVPGKKYSALIQGYPNDTSGLYPVFISELHAIDKSLTTIKVKNKLSNYGKWMYEGKVYSSGSYIPLHPGMTVTVVFLTASALSGSITEIHYDHTPFDKINQVGIHLIAKTPGGSQIYLDDSRGVTHIMHNNGRTNALLSDDKTLEKYFINYKETMENDIKNIKSNIKWKPKEEMTIDFFVKIKNNDIRNILIDNIDDNLKEELNEIFHIFFLYYHITN